MARRQRSWRRWFLDHVAEGAGFVVVVAAAFDADGFADGDLDVVDGVGVPEAFEDDVGEAEGEEVLDRLFSQVVVNSKNLGFGEDGGRRRPLMRLAEGRSWPMGFFEDDAGEVGDQAGGFEVFAGGAVEVGRGGHVEGRGCGRVVPRGGL